MTLEDKAWKVVDQMYNNDPFSQWLGIERIHHGPGECILKLTVKQEMLNGFSIAHGGIAYSLADSALAFAANGHGKKAVSIETSISHTQSCKKGDTLTAEAEEMSLTEKIGIYHIYVKNQESDLIALFKGTVYRTSNNWDI